MGTYGKYPASGGGGGGSGTVTSGANRGTGTTIFDSSASTASILKFKTLTAGTNITVTDDGAGNLTLPSTSGGGNVTSPGTAVIAGQVPVFSGTGGTAIAQPAGVNATNSFTVDLTRTGIEASLISDGNHAVTYYVGNTNSGTNARAIISMGNDTGNNVFSIGSTSSGYGGHPYPNVAIWASSFVNGSVFRNVDGSNAPFKWVQQTQTVAEILASSGAFRVWGNSATNRLTVSPGTGTWFDYTANVAGQITTSITNNSSSASAYNELDINGNAGSLLLGHTSSAVAGTWLRGDQGYVLSNNTAGMMIGTLAGPLRFIIGGSTAAQERMQIRANGVINMSLPTYATDAAAGSAGLVTGDLFINSGNSNAVTSKT